MRTLILAFGLIAACGCRDYGYGDFTAQNQQYYYGISMACDTLLAPSVNEYRMVEIPVSSAQVPQVLKQLNLRQILVCSNRVALNIGPRRTGGYVISWASSDQNASQWQLSVTLDDGPTKVLFFTNRVTAIVH